MLNTPEVIPDSIDVIVGGARAVSYAVSLGRGTQDIVHEITYYRVVAYNGRQTLGIGTYLTKREAWDLYHKTKHAKVLRVRGYTCSDSSECEEVQVWPKVWDDAA